MRDKEIIRNLIKDYNEQINEYCKTIDEQVEEFENIYGVDCEWSTFYYEEFDYVDRALELKHLLEAREEKFNCIIDFFDIEFENFYCGCNLKYLDHVEVSINMFEKASNKSLKYGYDNEEYFRICEILDSTLELQDERDKEYNLKELERALFKNYLK